MYSLKGFIKLPAFENNAVGEIATFGELSTRSRTFSREIGHYTDPAFPNVDLISFFSRRSDLGDVSLGHEYKMKVLEIAEWLYQHCITGKLTADHTLMLAALNDNFSGGAENFTSGPMLGDGSNWMPEYLSFNVLGVLGLDDGPENNLIKLWFSDDAFQRQYDEYEIITIPPVTPIDGLFDTYVAVRDKLADTTIKSVMGQVEILTEGDPYTYLRTMTFDWIDPFNEDNTVPTQWTVAIYGAFGDNPDSIKNALAEYVLSNSDYERPDWLARVPDLFRITEFILRPLWENYSVPNQSLVAGIYSPVMNISKLAFKAAQVAPGYPELHIPNALESMTFIYKSLGMLVIPGPENRAEVISMDVAFPDYAAVATTSLDFNRMSPRTQEWILLMYELVIASESATEFSDLPFGITRVFREGIMYLNASFEEVNYLMVTKGTVVEMYNLDEIPVITVGQDKPRPQDDLVTVAQNSSVTGTLIQNDTPSSDGGNAYSLDPTAMPTNGIATVEVDGTFTYTPNPGFDGQDTFRYVVTDIDGSSSTAEVTVNVHDVDEDQPIARRDEYTTLEGTELVGRVSDNDTESVDGDNWYRVDGDDLPEEGIVDMEDNGEFIYMPNSGYTGFDGFSYTIIDKDGSESSARVTIEVLPSEQ